MSRRVFLDIGAHEGETLSVVMELAWGFDRIYSFEPAPHCWTRLEEMADHRVEICRFGLWDKDTELQLHAPGEVGASVSADKELAQDSVLCEFRDVASWFREHINPEDEVFAKINVEGAEAELVERLHSTGTLGLIDHLLIHFDVRKVPSKRHLEGQIRQRLDLAGVEYVPAEEIQFGVVGRGTRRWLRWSQADRRWRDLRYKALGRAGAAVRRRLYPLKSWLVQASAQRH